MICYIRIKRNVTCDKQILPKGALVMNAFHRNDKNHSAQTKERELTTKILLGLMGAQMMMVPLAGTALAKSAIIKVTGAGPKDTIVQNDGVYTVYADKMDNGVAVNHFTQFSLDSGNIANLYFRTKDATADASRLFNFVENHIDINGTVNAIRNGNVGGQLFFLSSDGITVGAGGVINAGSINLLTPTITAYNSMLSEADLGKLSDTIVNNKYAVDPAATITVAGQLNAPNGIKLRTANIKIQKGATLRTGDVTKDADGKLAVSDTIDFSNLVNTKKADGTELSAGITGGKLRASKNANGDIVLSAISASTASAKDEKFFDELADNFTPQERNASVTTEDGSSILARGAANIFATATNTNELWKTDDGYDPYSGNPLGQITSTKADISLGGKIHAKTIDAEATSSNLYTSDNETMSFKFWGKILDNASWFKGGNIVKSMQETLNVIPVYAYMSSEANLHVQKTAELTATKAPAAKTETPVNSAAAGEVSNLDASINSEISSALGEEGSPSDNEIRSDLQADGSTGSGNLGASGDADTPAINLVAPA